VVLDHRDAGAGRVRVVFDQPQRAVTPGQSVVFYDADACLGGAVIEETR
jgi:tRNA-specific 2-thiouridylase